METDIYGIYRTRLEQVMETLVRDIRAYSEQEKVRTGSTIYEHLLYRIKTDSSMRGKCDRKGLPQTERSALYDIHDAIGLRIVCRFIDDIYTNIDCIRHLPQVEVVEEKITSAMPSPTDIAAII